MIEKLNLPFVPSATANMHGLQKITSFALPSRNMSCRVNMILQF